jgi:hypothetical protein
MDIENFINNVNSFKINNVEFCLKKNIKSYYQNRRKSLWETKEYNEELKYNEPITFIILCSPCYHHTIGHFVFDGFIYLQYFNEIKEKLKQYGIKNIKVHLHKNPPREFKKLFINLFEISEKEILYSDIPGSYWKDNYEYNDSLPINNICIVPENFACHDKIKNTVESERFKSIIFDYKLFINNKIKILNKENKKIDVLVFLRNDKSKEVEPNNNRSIDYTHLLKYLKKKNRQVTLYNPINETKNYLDQIKLIKSCNYLVVEYGASLWLNGLFAKNLIVIVLGTTQIHNELNYKAGPHLNNIYKCIEKNSNIFFLTTTHNYKRIGYNIFSELDTFFYKNDKI